MKISGHTMGTPEYSILEAIDLFKRAGLDGIEMVVQDDYHSGIPVLATGESLLPIREKLAETGLAVAGLTPYLNLFNALDESVRLNECALLRKVIDMAAFFGAKNIRIYGGKFVDGETDAEGRKRAQLIRSMRECGDYCHPLGIRLCLENHFGTMTATATATASIVAEIDHPNVGVLYDQANIAFLPAEEYEEAIDLQKGKIFFVHCKDLVYRGGSPQKPKFAHVSFIDENERTVHSRIPGQGILDWPAILRKLKAVGYDGWISLEYERRWQKIDLPDASIGIPVGAEFIRGILADL